MLVYSNASLNIQESMVNFCISINKGMWSVVLVSLGCDDGATAILRRAPQARMALIGS